MGIYLGGTELSTGGGGGAGGITKFKKYSTQRSLADTDVRTTTNPIGPIEVTPQAFYTPTQVINCYVDVIMDANAMAGQIMTAAGAWSGTSVIASHPAITNTGSSMFPITFASPYPSYANGPGQDSWSVPIIRGDSITVNPATDLLLADGATVGVLLVSGGGKGGGTTGVTGGMARGGYGGRLLYKVTTITTAATNLVLQIGAGDSFNGPVLNPSADSIITGGLALTSADGNNVSGYPANYNSRSGSVNNYVYSYVSTGAGPGNYSGYGIGGRITQFDAYNGGDGQHGWGAGGTQSDTVGGDGAIILYY